MDSLITASARALAVGDPLGALKQVALRDDPPSLAMRGIAMAQLGEYVRARELLKQAARGFGSHEGQAQARCIIAEAEVALAMRDFSGSPRTLLSAASRLDMHADHANALTGRLIAARRLLLLGRLGEARAAVAQLNAQINKQLGANSMPPSRVTMLELTIAELALRSLHIEEARAALLRADMSARQAQVPALINEAAEVGAMLERPAARLISRDGSQLLRLGEVASLLASDTLVADACRRGIGTRTAWQPLARRPVLFALARALAEAWPGDADREKLIAEVFRTRHSDDTHRARLRVEIGRLRALIAPLAAIEATERGFKICPHGGRRMAVLLPPIEGELGALVALLSDGAAWSTSALSMALGMSQRTVQRSLAELEAAGQVRSVGSARSQRWLSPPLTGFATILLLPSVISIV